MRILILLIIGVVVLLLVSSAGICVDRTEFVYVTEFGKPVQTWDGATDAGLHFKLPWPIQTVQRLDHRLQVFDLPGAELLTHDPKGQTIDKTLTVGAYVCWRIAGVEGVDRFIRTVGTPERAEAILGQQISSRLGATIGKMELAELVGVATSTQVEERMDRLNRQLLGVADNGNGLQEGARRDYGIELVDIRLRRFNYPPQTRDAIFDRIRSERNRKVADYQSEGAQLAQNIKSQADYEASTILAEARATEQRKRGEAEARADGIRNEAQAKDPAFYAFLRKLSGYQQILGDNKTMLLLSSHRELFDVLFKPPSAEGGGPGATGATVGEGKPAADAARLAKPKEGK
jgi:membrane protease subunit HflC